MAIGVTALLLARVSPYVSVAVGAVLTILSVGLMAAAASFGSIVLFLGWCIVGGVAYSFAFSGGLGVINQAAPVAHRGATLSLLYLVAYALQAATAIGIGALATATTLGAAVGVAATTLTGLCLVLLILAFINGRTKRSSARQLTTTAGSPQAIDTH